jgi:hypothetical protein
LAVVFEASLLDRAVPSSWVMVKPKVEAEGEGQAA